MLARAPDRVPEGPITPRWLIRFGYDGAGFAGWARQPGLRTVEEEIRSALVRLGIVARIEDARLEVASRTDRGVSARANALALDADLGPERIVRSLNALGPDIFFTHIRSVPSGFHPRRAAGRTYRYFEAIEGARPKVWRTAAKLFEGEVDVRSLGRGVPPEVPAARQIERVRVTSRPPFLVVEIQAPSFVWGMVRKIIAALRAVDRGKLGIDVLRLALSGRRRLALPLAEPEPLVLWEVRYDQGWGRRRGRLTLTQHSHFRTQVERAEARARVLSTLLD